MRMPWCHSPDTPTYLIVEPWKKGEKSCQLKLPAVLATQTNPLKYYIIISSGEVRKVEKLPCIEVCVEKVKAKAGHEKHASSTIEVNVAALQDVILGHFPTESTN